MADNPHDMPTEVMIEYRALKQRVGSITSLRTVLEDLPPVRFEVFRALHPKLFREIDKRARGRGGQTRGR